MLAGLNLRRSARRSPRCRRRPPRAALGSGALGEHGHADGLAGAVRQARRCRAAAGRPDGCRCPGGSAPVDRLVEVGRRDLLQQLHSRERGVTGPPRICFSAAATVLLSDVFAIAFSFRGNGERASVLHTVPLLEEPKDLVDGACSSSKHAAGKPGGELLGRHVLLLHLATLDAARPWSGRCRPRSPWPPRSSLAFRSGILISAISRS